MDIDERIERLLQAEDHLGDAYALLAGVRDELKTAGQKKDVAALNELLERLGRYGRMLGEMRESWRAPLD